LTLGLSDDVADVAALKKIAGGKKNGRAVGSD
jgi:hypothetical protein